MDVASFAAGFPGRFVPIPDGVWGYTIRPRPSGLVGFVPDPLPAKIDLDAAASRLLERAVFSLGALRGLSSFLPDPSLLAGPLMRREAIASSRIEGTFATAEQLAMFDIPEHRGLLSPQVREVWNYRSALESGINRTAEPFSLDEILRLHRQLMGGRGVRGNERTPGEFRHVQNWIGGARDGRPESARYLPPPPDDMQDALDVLSERIVSPPDTLPPILDIALVHYQFEAIHPFIDGNGRVGRLLVTLMLARQGLLEQPFLHLSSFFERRADEYRNSLLNVSQKGDWLGWASYFLTGVVEEATAAAERAKALWKLREEYREKVQSLPRASVKLSYLVDSLFRSQVLTIPEAARQLEQTYLAAKGNVERLVNAGILTEIQGLHGVRTFVCPEILDLIHTSQTRTSAN